MSKQMRMQKGLWQSLQRSFYFFAGICICLLFIIISCTKQEMTGYVTLKFTCTHKGKELKLPLLQDTIPSGNIIQVEEVQYFISRLTFITENGERYTLSANQEGIHYVDLSIPSTLTWSLPQRIPNGHYTAIEFIYGINSEDNKSLRFKNAPENLMFWPEALGGGYHYMKINGKWRDAGNDTLRSYGLHTGIGQTMEQGKPTIYHPNFVTICQENLSFFITAGGTLNLNLNMEISQWFQDPHIWDFKIYGGAIMQNQVAQQVLKDNVRNVFSLSVAK